MTSVDHDWVLADYARLAPDLDIRQDVLANVEGPLIFEGAQGVLLDEDYGFHPHTTWSHTTAVNAQILAKERNQDLSVLGLTRSYSSRHGAGPFVAEDNTLNLPEAHNGAGHYQGGWRVGHLDVVALRHAVQVAKPDALYVTHLDALDRESRVQAATGYIVQGQTWTNLPIVDPYDFIARSELTSKLADATAVLESLGADQIHSFLGLELAGSSAGPKTSDGSTPTSAGR